MTLKPTCSLLAVPIMLLTEEGTFVSRPATKFSERLWMVPFPEGGSTAGVGRVHCWKWQSRARSRAPNSRRGCVTTGASEPCLHAQKSLSGRSWPAAQGGSMLAWEG